MGPIALLALLLPVTPLQASEEVARGAEIYKEHCASCHGAELEGQANWRQRGPDGRLPAPPHDETGHTWHHPDQVLFQITKEGVAAFAPKDYVTDMAAFGDVLSDEEITAVIDYIKSTWPAEIQLRQKVLTEGYRAQ
ncbi:MAG: cytochrome c [Pseudomonadota bacterium]